jgi:hypothetical protein
MALPDRLSGGPARGDVAGLAGVAVWGVTYVNGPVAGFSNIDPHVFL